MRWCRKRRPICVLIWREGKLLKLGSLKKVNVFKKDEDLHGVVFDSAGKCVSV